MASKFTRAIANAVAPAVEELLTESLATVLRKIQPAETRRDVLITLYVPIDSQLEKLTDETKTKLDDAGIDAIKAAIELVAAEDGVTLPNVDND